LCTGKRRGECRVSVRERPLERPRPKCVDNIRMDLKAVIWEGEDWIDQAQDRFL
jgi:hypothetical protein